MHQYLFEHGEVAAHAGEPWRREIMRLTKVITGKEIWAGASKSMRQNGSFVRRNVPRDDGTPSLPQRVIARWSHDGIGIDLEELRFDGLRMKARAVAKLQCNSARKTM
jgi:hypothetical protein